MRVPLSSLRFQDEDGRVVMGVISWRWIARKNEVTTFPAIRPDSGFRPSWKPSRAQEVVLEGVRSRKPLYIAPYTLGGYSQVFDLNDEETDYQKQNDPVIEAGLDIKYGLSSNLTLDLTVNTDFAQVEADDVQVNLTRFSLFSPKKGFFSKKGPVHLNSVLGGKIACSTAGVSGFMKMRKRRNSRLFASMEEHGWWAEWAAGTWDF